MAKEKKTEKKVAKRVDKTEPARTFENQELRPIEANTTEDLLLRGWAYRVKHELDAAEADLRAVLKADPKSVFAKYGLAQVLMEQNKKDEASKAFNEVAKWIDDGALKGDPVRADMLRRQALGHAQKLKSGSWDLENIGNALPKSAS
jgi:Tfp pilus assembly protein PilF